MHCPYCYGAVHEEASRCPHCGSEIAVFHPLLRRLDELQARVEALELAALQARADPTAHASPAALATPHREAAAAGVPASGPNLPGQASELEHLPVPPPAAAARRLAVWAWATIALLGGLHLLLLFGLDASPLSLRVATLVVPLAAGALALRHHWAPAGARAVFSLTVGLGAVGLMLGITAVLDGVSFWPADAREWRETLEYTVGITLAHLGGGLAPGSWRRARAWRQALRRAASQTQQVPNKPLTGWRAVAARWAERIAKVASFIAPVATCVTAFYSGLRSFLGL